jgi:hypothetical protein
MRSLVLAIALFCTPVLLASAPAEAAKKCKKGCACGDACIDCKKKCEVGAGSAGGSNKKGQFCSANSDCASGSCAKKHCK